MNLLYVMIGAFSLVAGIPMLAAPGKRRLAAEARTAARRAELAAGTRERYFEERRSLNAYTPSKSDAVWRIKGMFGVLAGVALLIIGVLR
jgi:hypothetical protein